MELPKLSDEQQNIINYIKNGYNVIVDAVAGCGKTTTSLSLCNELKNMKILMLTYNSGLKIDTRKKIDKYKLENIQVHSYHSFCLNYYKKPCYDDLCMYKLIKSDILFETEFDIIIMDEQQDMKPLFYELVQVILKNNKSNPQLCLFGDIFQNIYSYQGSNIKYLIEGDKLFPSDRQWVKASISTTFRNTKEICNFVNSVLLKQNRLNSTKDGDKSKYIITNNFNPINIYKMIIKYIEQGYRYEDIFVLAPSINSKTTPVKKLENLCVNNGMPCLTTISDNGPINEDIIKGKIVFTSFHQSKGLERKIVFVYCLDTSYYWYGKNESKDICPNPIYVACTRALEHLVIVHNKYRDYLPFIDKTNIESIVNINGSLTVKEKTRNDSDTNKIINKPVTDFIRSLDFENIEKILNNLSIKTITKPKYNVEIKNKIINKNGLIEDVSNINGTAIPAYYEMLTSKNCKLYNSVIHDSENLPQDQQDKLFNIGKKSYSDKFVTIEDMCYLAVLQECRMSGYWSKLYQIDDYTWLTNEENIDQFNRILKIINKNIHAYANNEYEYRIEKNIKQDYIIAGFIDCIDHTSKTIWEFKCVSNISDLHILQLTMYAYISKQQFPDYRYKILNLLSGEVLEVQEIQFENIDEIILDIIKKYY